MTVFQHQNPNYFRSLLYQGSFQDDQYPLQTVLYIPLKETQGLHLYHCSTLMKNYLNNAEQIVIIFKVLASEGIAMYHTIMK